MATPESQVPEQPEKVAKAQKPRTKKGSAGPAVNRGKGTRKGKKSAREFAVEILTKHSGKMKFGELVKEVSKRMGGKLTWTPTYYLKSPGFSRPERGVVAFSKSDEEKGRAEIKKARQERLAKARPRKGPSKASKKPSGKKGETVLERRQRTAAERQAKEAEAKAEFDEAAAKEGVS